METVARSRTSKENLLFGSGGRFGIARRHKKCTSFEAPKVRPSRKKTPKLERTS